MADKVDMNQEVNVEPNQPKAPASMPASPAPRAKAPVGVFVLLLLILGNQGLVHYQNAQRKSAIEAFLRENDRDYQRTVFNDESTKGVMQQVFRQNEANRELMKAILEIEK